MTRFLSHAFASVAGIAVLVACSSPSFGSPPPGEALVRVTEKFPGTADQAPPGQRQCRLIMGHEDLQPAQVRQDLAALSQAIENLGINLETATIEATPNGRTVVVNKRGGSSYVGPPSGVWIWPDWRNAANVIHVPDFTEAHIHSNYHIRLIHFPREGASSSRVIDWRNHEHRFHFQGFQLNKLRIADNGRFAGPLRDGALVVGRLNPNDPEWAQHAFTVPTGGEVEGLLFRRNGAILMVDVNVGDRLVKSFRLTDDAAIQAGSISAYLVDDCAVSDDAVFVMIPPSEDGINKLCAVDAGGALTIQSLDWAEDGSEDPTWISPSGKFLLTESSVWPPGAVDVDMRKTPKAAPGDPLPAIPPTHEKIGGGEFWVSWETP